MEDEATLNETVERVFSIIVRHRWWILTPVCVSAFATAALLLWTPNRYTSEATLLLHQQVLQRYILPPSPNGNAEVVQAATRQVLSRTELVGIIKQFGLYPKQRQQHVEPENLAERMRKDIAIAPLDPSMQTDFNAFKIAFTANDPQVAQAVASRLTQLFIDENLRTRETQASSTSNFLKEQLDAAKDKLAEQERRLQAFKAQHPGQLAEQQAVNLAALTDLRMQLQSTRNSLNRSQDQRASLESSVSGVLARLQAERTELLTHYTAKHPEVLKKNADITQAEAVLAYLKSGTPGADLSPAMGMPNDPVLAELVKQAETNGHERESLSNQETRLRTELSHYQGQLNLTPVREQELAGILRDYDLYKQLYSELLTKQQQSQLATNLAESRDSMRFRLLDPPNLPVRPSGPKRVKISLGGLAGGLLLGLALAFMVHARDRSFHSERDLSRRVGLPFVVAIPVLLSDREQRARNWTRALEWVGGSMIMLAAAAAEFLVCRLG
jgi:succinoglycan biosynthesis transport protein ExoP